MYYNILAMQDYYNKKNYDPFGVMGGNWDHKQKTRFCDNKQKQWGNKGKTNRIIYTFVRKNICQLSANYPYSIQNVLEIIQKC